MRAGTVNRNVRLLAYHIGLPDDFTCWHVGDGVHMFEMLRIVLVTDRARWNGDESYSTAEAEKELMSDWEKVVPKLRTRLTLVR
jgi:hypothetical protein